MSLSSWRISRGSSFIISECSGERGRGGQEGGGGSTSLVDEEGQVGVAVLAVLADNTAVVEGVGVEELLGLPVEVDVDLGQGVVGGRLLVALSNAGLEPGEQELQAVALLDSRNEVCGFEWLAWKNEIVGGRREGTIDRAQVPHGHDELLDVLLAAVDIEESTDNGGGVDRVDLLHVGLLHKDTVVRRRTVGGRQKRI